MSSGKFRYKVNRPTWENVPPGTYTLRLTDVTEGPEFTNRKTGEPEQTVKLHLEVHRGPQKGMGLSALVNPDNWGPKSNATRWAEALSGSALEDDEAFDFEAWIDQLVWAKVIVEPDGKGVERNKVDVVLPMAALEAQATGGAGYAGPLPAAPDPPPGQLRLGRGLEERPAQAPTGRRRVTGKPARQVGPDEEIRIDPDDPILGKDGEEAPF